MKMNITDYLSVVYGVDKLIDKEDKDFSFIFSLYDEMQSNVVSINFPALLVTKSELSESLYISYQDNEYILVSILNYAYIVDYALSIFPSEELQTNTNLEIQKSINQFKDILMLSNSIYRQNWDKFYQVPVGFIVIHELTHFLIKNNEDKMNSLVHEIIDKINITNFDASTKHNLKLFANYFNKIDNNKHNIEEIVCDYFASEILWSYFVFGYIEVSPKEFLLSCLTTIKAIIFLNRPINDVDLYVRESVLSVMLSNNIENYLFSLNLFSYYSEYGNTISESKFQEISSMTDVFSNEVLLPYLDFFNKYTEVISSFYVENYFANDDELNRILIEKNTNEVILYLKSLNDILFENEICMDELYNQSPLKTINTTIDLRGKKTQTETQLDSYFNKLENLSLFQKIFRSKIQWNVT